MARGITSGFQDRVLFIAKVVSVFTMTATVSILTGLVEVQTFRNEVEYAKGTQELRAKYKAHRCNDRLEDVVQVLFGEESHTFRDFRPSFRNWWKCVRSETGQEPAMPYVYLLPGDLHYIDPASRRKPGTAAVASDQ